MPPVRFPSFVPVFDRAQHRSWHRLGRAMRSVRIIVPLMIAASHTAMAKAASPNPASTMKSRADSYASFVAEAARRFAIPASWIGAVIQAESSGDPAAVSPKGAMGLMQLVPETWTALRAHYRLGANPFDPHDNILAGAAYLRQMYDRFGEAGFLAAYNAGPSHYENYLTTGQPLPAETHEYLAKLAHLIGDRQIIRDALAKNGPIAWTHSSLFVRQMMNGSAHGVADNASAVVVQTGRTSANYSVDNVFALAPQSDGLFVHRPTAGDSL